MNRRRFLLSAASLATLVASAGAAHASIEDKVAARLRREGYRIVQRKRTWLGRVRFIAVRSREERELVLDPSSGEILRDYSTTISIASDGPSGRGEGRGGPGPREDTSDEPSDDDADDDADEEAAREEEERARAEEEEAREAAERARHEEELDAER
ncbi:MAG: hypothetical protein KDE00_03735 [Rhodobacteraceae bacterium]|nr:hypothetical protein [Paracoccaceae bacterium]